MHRNLFTFFFFCKKSKSIYPVLSCVAIIQVVNLRALLAHFKWEPLKSTFNLRKNFFKMIDLQIVYVVIRVMFILSKSGVRHYKIFIHFSPIAGYHFLRNTSPINMIYSICIMTRSLMLHFWWNFKIFT